MRLVGALSLALVSLIVAACGAARVELPLQRNAIEGGDLTVQGISGSAVNLFNLPRGISVDASGRIYVADWGNQRIVRTNDMAGAGWTTFGTVGSGVNQFSGPAGIPDDGCSG